MIRQIRALLLLSLVLTTMVFADKRPISLDKITFQLRAEEWASTKTARVTVSVNAALNKQQLGEMHQQVMKKLTQISSKSTWHLITYYRSKDQSGLEQLNILAQARLPERELAGLRGKAKSVSKPGETYRIQNIEFTPSLVELEQVRNKLREKIYQEVKKEIAKLNTIYPTQHFFVNQINFSGPQVFPASYARRNVLAAEVKKSSSPKMQVSQKIKMVATIVAASKTGKSMKQKPQAIARKGRS